MAKIEVIVLGTASMIPTKERNLTSIHLSYEDKGILFDCGEGTQRQMKMAGIKPSKISKILISHWHGDHVLGLPGLLQTMGNSGFEGRLDIYGPIGTKEFMASMLKGFVFDTPIDMDIHEVKDGTIFENEEFFIETKQLSHGIPCQGYSFIEKDQRKMEQRKLDKLGIKGPDVGKLQKGMSITLGKKIIHPDEVSHVEAGKKVTVIMDTEMCNGAVRLARNSDVLFCESTYLGDLEDKGMQYKHMTSKQAALLASNNNVGELILCHFSQRYKTTEDLEKEARDIFPSSRCAYDLMKVRV